MGEHAERQSTLPNWEQLNANTYTIDVNLDRCQSEDPHPASDRDCLNGATKQWDGQLNNVYNRLMEDVGRNSPTGTALRDSERQWINFQQAEGKTIDSLLNTDDANVLIARASMQLHKDRANELLGVKVDYPDLNGKTLQSLEKDLNDTYNKLRAELNPQQKDVLKNSQLEWLKFREKENNFIDKYHPWNGKLPAENIYSQMQITSHRTKQLEFLLKNHQ